MLSSSVFPEDFLESKLLTLKDTQESIQSLSHWCIHRQEHHKKIVSIWLRVLKTVQLEHRLTLFYLANDVIQYSKKRHLPFIDSWATALQRATPLVRDQKIKQKVLRLIKIWSERSIYDETFLADLSGLLYAKIKSSNERDTRKKNSKEGFSRLPPAKRGARPESNHDEESEVEGGEENGKGVVEEEEEILSPEMSDAEMSGEDVVEVASLTSSANDAEIEAYLMQEDLDPEFQPNLLCEKIKTCFNLHVESQMALQKLYENPLINIEDEPDFDEFVDSKPTGQALLDELHGVSLEANNCLTALMAESKESAQVIRTIMVSRNFYNTQRGEANVVYNAYNNFGERIKMVREQLTKLIPNLPEEDSPQSPTSEAESARSSPADSIMPSPISECEEIEAPDISQQNAFRMRAAQFSERGTSAVEPYRIADSDTDIPYVPSKIARNNTMNYEPNSSIASYSTEYNTSSANDAKNLSSFSYTSYETDNNQNGSLNDSHMSHRTYSSQGNSSMDERGGDEMQGNPIQVIGSMSASSNGANLYCQLNIATNGADSRAEIPGLGLPIVDSEIVSLNFLEQEGEEPSYANKMDTSASPTVRWTVPQVKDVPREIPSYSVATNSPMDKLHPIQWNIPLVKDFNSYTDATSPTSPPTWNSVPQVKEIPLADIPMSPPNKLDETPTRWNISLPESEISSYSAESPPRNMNKPPRPLFQWNIPQLKEIPCDKTPPSQIERVVPTQWDVPPPTNEISAFTETVVSPALRLDKPPPPVRFHNPLKKDLSSLLLERIKSPPPNFLANKSSPFKWIDPQNDKVVSQNNINILQNAANVQQNTASFPDTPQSPPLMQLDRPPPPIPWNIPPPPVEQYSAYASNKNSPIKTLCNNSPFGIEIGNEISSYADMINFSTDNQMDKTTNYFGDVDHRNLISIANLIDVHDSTMSENTIENERASENRNERYTSESSIDGTGNESIKDNTDAVDMEMSDEESEKCKETLSPQKMEVSFKIGKFAPRGREFFSRSPHNDVDVGVTSLNDCRMNDNGMIISEITPQYSMENENMPLYSSENGNMSQYSAEYNRLSADNEGPHYLTNNIPVPPLASLPLPNNLPPPFNMHVPPPQFPFQSFPSLPPPFAFHNGPVLNNKHFANEYASNYNNILSPNKLGDEFSERNNEWNACERNEEQNTQMDDNLNNLEVSPKENANPRQRVNSNSANSDRCNNANNNSDIDARENGFNNGPSNSPLPEPSELPSPGPLSGPPGSPLSEPPKPPLSEPPNPSLSGEPNSPISGQPVSPLSEQQPISEPPNQSIAPIPGSPNLPMSPDATPHGDYDRGGDMTHQPPSHLPFTPRQQYFENAPFHPNEFSQPPRLRPGQRPPFRYGLRLPSGPRMRPPPQMRWKNMHPPGPASFRQRNNNPRYANRGRW